MTDDKANSVVCVKLFHPVWGKFNDTDIMLPEMPPDKHDNNFAITNSILVFHYSPSCKLTVMMYYF